MLSRCSRFMSIGLAALVALSANAASAQSFINRDGPRPSGGRPIGGFGGGGGLIGAGMGLGGLLLNNARRPPSDQPPDGPPTRYRKPPYTKVQAPRPVAPRHPRPVKQPPVIVARTHPPRPPRPIVKAARPRPSFPVPAVDERRYVPDEILISIKEQVPPERLRRMEASYGLAPLAVARITLLGLDVRRYRIRSGASVPQTIRALNGAPRFIAAVQPNFVFDLQDDAPSVPVLDPKPITAALPAAPVIDSKPMAAEPVSAKPRRPPQYAITTLRLEAAHKIATGTDVLIAVIDTGMDETHPDIAGMVADRFDAVGGPFVPLSHGTAMAGVIVAHTGLVGIAPGARLIAVRAFTSLSNGGANGTGFDILRGLDFAATHGARIVNMSFAGPEDAFLHDALDVARTRGIIAIAAAGNAGPGSKPLFPAAQPGVIAVTATDSDNRLFAMANRGAYVAVAAPGVNILAPTVKGAVQLTSGTSVATAEVSGVAALLVQGHGKTSPDDVRKLLQDTAQRLPLEPALAGAGLVDAFAAVSAAR